MMKWLKLSVLAIGLLAACGDDSGSKSKTSANNTSSNNAASNNTAGSSTDTSFDVKVGEDSYAREVKNTAATQETAAAVIAGDLVNLYMVSTDGVALSAVIQTTAANGAPGTFAVGSPPEGTFVQITDAVHGAAYGSVSGSIRLDSCPGAVGEKVVGAFVNVQLSDELGGGTKTLSGDFDLAVISKSGDLFCAAVSSNNTTNNVVNNTTDTCDADMCDSDGVCCPYMPCISQCQVSCVTSTACLTGDVVACAQCSMACPTTCEVSAACGAAFEDLGVCEEDNSCDAFGDEEVYNECMGSSCCAELKAAF